MGRATSITLGLNLRGPKVLGLTIRNVSWPSFVSPEVWRGLELSCCPSPRAEQAQGKQCPYWQGFVKNRMLWAF